MQIVRAKAADAETLTEIAFAAKRHWGYPERWIQMWKPMLTILPDYAAMHETYIANIDAEPVGFYVLVASAKGVRLEHLWVRPRVIGRGIGRGLFEHAAERARILGFKSVDIESDPNAEKFYERMGARRVGTNRTALEGEVRELPLLSYDCSKSVSDPTQLSGAPIANTLPDTG